MSDVMEINTESKDSIIKSLDIVAKDLICNKAIKINDSVYSFIDVELYYYHPNHQDEFAKGVDHNRPKGEFEAHRYGLDLSLGNDKDNGFGGILICGLYDVFKKEVIEKPRVLRSLFNQLSIGENKIELKSRMNSCQYVFRSKRKNLGESDTQNKVDFKPSLYKYLIKDSSVFKKYKGKEAIYRESDLSESEKLEMLGYKLNC